MTFSESALGKSWWAKVDKVVPHLASYADDFMKARTTVFSIQQHLQSNSRTDKDVAVLGKLFHKIWFDAPDSPRIRDYPEWHTLCDICSDYSEVYAC